MSHLDNDINQHFQDAHDVILGQHSNDPYYEQEYKYYETVGIHQPPVRHIIPGPIYEWNETTQQCWPHLVSDVSVSHSVTVDSPPFYSILPPQRNGKGRKKLRLYEYLHQALNDPNMGDSIQWTDSSSGTFHFISKNKEKLAEFWGQRKGNRKTMTYQKMARALRNYSRTGEIIKVRRKLTYQFNPVILQRLGGTQVAEHPSCHHHAQEPVPLHNQPHTQAEQGYYMQGPDWHSWYGHYPLQEEYDLATSFTSSSSSSSSQAVTKV